MYYEVLAANKQFSKQKDWKRNNTTLFDKIIMARTHLKWNITWNAMFNKNSEKGKRKYREWLACSENKKANMEWVAEIKTAQCNSKSANKTDQ